MGGGLLHVRPRGGRKQASQHDIIVVRDHIGERDVRDGARRPSPPALRREPEKHDSDRGLSGGGHTGATDRGETGTCDHFWRKVKIAGAGGGAQRILWACRSRRTSATD